MNDHNWTVIRGLVSYPILAIKWFPLLVRQQVCLCLVKFFSFITLSFLFSLLSLIQAVHAVGMFELQIRQWQNSLGTLHSGQCCDLQPSGGQRCPQSDQCDTFFKVCLKEYQARVAPTGTCTFGTGSTPVLGGNSHGMHHHGPEAGRIIIPFKYAWPVSPTSLFNYVMNYTEQIHITQLERGWVIFLMAENCLRDMRMHLVTISVTVWTVSKSVTLIIKVFKSPLWLTVLLLISLPFTWPSFQLVWNWDGTDNTVLIMCCSAVAEWVVWSVLSSLLIESL